MTASISITYKGMIFDDYKMPNVRRKVSVDDYLDCYQYFRRAISLNRWPDDSCVDQKKALDSFAAIKIEGSEEQTIEALQSWIDCFVDDQTWGLCYRALNQKKYAAKKIQKTIQISEEAYLALQDYTSQHSISYSESILKLIKDKGIQGNNAQLSQPTGTESDHHSKTSSKLVKNRKNNIIYLFTDAPGDELGGEAEIEEDYLFTESRWAFNEEPIDYPCRPYNYDFRKNESYKAYRKRINNITLKKPDESLGDEFHNAIKKNYFLKENNAQEVGLALLALRNRLSDRQLLSKKFEKDDIVISKGITMPAYQEERYGDELMHYTSELWGCVCKRITSGKSEPSVFCGAANHVHLAYQTFHYINAFLRSEAEIFIETCHKNTKKSNKYLKAGYHANHLLYLIFSEIFGDDGDHRYLSDEEEKILFNLSFSKVGYYHDENEPLGGWRD